MKTGLPGETAYGQRPLTLRGHVASYVGLVHVNVQFGGPLKFCAGGGGREVREVKVHLELRHEAGGRKANLKERGSDLSDSSADCSWSAHKYGTVFVTAERLI